MLEKYPQAQITVIDATINTVLQGQYVLEAAELRDHGFSYSDAAARLEEIKSTGRIFFKITSYSKIYKNEKAVVSVKRNKPERSGDLGT